MALEGSIQDFGLTEIFQLILIQKKEGILTLAQEAAIVCVHFKEGQIVRAGDENEDETFGNVLIKSRKMTTDQLKKGLMQHKTKKQPLADTLVDLGYIPAAEIKKLHRLIAEETIFQLFKWKTGEYKFEQKEVLYNPELIEPLSTEFTLMEAMRQIDEWPLLLKKIPSKETVVELIPAENLQPTDSEQEEKSDPPIQDPSSESFASLAEPGDAGEEINPFTQWIDGKRTVQEIIDLSEMGAFSVYKGLADLLSEGKVKIRTGKEGQAASGQMTIKRLTRSQTLYKTLVGGLAIAVSLIIFILSYPSISVTLHTAAAPIQEVRNLSVWNQRDLIQFSLDLYYLKHGHFPGSLHELLKEGLLNTQKEREIDLEKWSYSPQENSFALTLK
jgi:competence protein ComGC